MDNSEKWNAEEKRLERKERLNSLKQKDGIKKPIRKTSKFTRIFLPIIAVLVILGIGGWMAVQFALPQKLFPPMSVNGSNISSAEFSYYYYNVLSGLSIDRTTDEGKAKLKTLCTVEDYTDVTWQEYAYELTAQQVVETQIKYGLAQESGLELDATQIEELDTMFENIVTQMGSDLEADKYLMDLFGKDVTMKSLRPVFEKASLADKYMTTTIAAMEIGDDDIEKVYNENKNDYDKVTFRLAYFATETETDATTEEKAAASKATKALADAFLAKVTDGTVFRTLSEEKTAADELAAYKAMTAEEKATADAAKTKETKDKADLLATMTEEEKSAYLAAEANYDPSIIYSMAKTDVDGASADLGTWLFDSKRAEGDKSAFEIGSGYYAIYFVSRDSEFHLPSVRHILISPNKDKDTAAGDVFTADEWIAARKTANDVLALCTSEEKFKELVTEHSTDTGSVATGGLYEELARGQMVATFNDWSFDPARKAGDTAIVRSEYGFHIMWFVGLGDSTSLTKNSDTIKAQIAQEKFDAVMTEMKAQEEYQYTIHPFGVRLTDLV
ncbi:MAG: peptidylprolyl isomerase [Saccharofermentanales bacterium]